MNFLSVVGQFHTFGKHLVNSPVKPYVVTHMSDQGASDPHPVGKGKRIIYQLVRVVGFVETQGIHTEDFDTLEQGTVTVRDRDTMAQDRVAVADLESYIAERIKY